MDHFKALYAADSNYINYPIFACFPRLHNNDYVDIERKVTQEDIKDVVFAMGSWKAPDSDGLSVKFYQQFWDIIAESITTWVKYIFQNPANIAKVNKTLIGVSADNILVVQEVVHTMRDQNQGKGLMAIKIDLEKIYDRLNWDFVVDTLKDAGIPDNIINVIAFCISTPTMNLLWNGSPSESFTLTRGIRQEDPLSRYLFVLCVKRLSHLINKLVKGKKWEPISISRNRPNLSHLYFADDLVLFARANSEQVHMIKKTLHTFCDSSR
ncbi:hypothetical protein AHAS_Ahas16G0235400 [Arachis hypogaea]